MRVRILCPALEDLAAGREFYDRQCEGVGGYFFDSLFAEIDSLVLYAGIHRVQFGYHRLLAKRFPYAIYYRISGGEAVVYRVLDCRRDPKWIARALQTG
jgi:plasmid stabilization system protein ParE